MAAALNLIGNVVAGGISGASVQRFGSGFGSAPDAVQCLITTEAQCQSAFSTGGTLSNYFVNVPTNARTTDTVLAVRLNSADTTITVTYTSGQTGVKSDTSHSATVAQDDLLSTGVTTSTGAGTFMTGGSGIRFVATSGTTASFFGVNPSGNQSGTGPITNFVPIGGILTPSTTETDWQWNVQAAGTAKYLQAFVNVNTRSTDTVLTFRKNAADGAQTFTYTTGQTGLKKDTSNTDSVSAGDKAALKCVLGTGTGNFALMMIGFHIASTTDGQSAAALVRTRTIAAASTTYNMVGGDFNQNATESLRQQVAGTPATASKLWCNVNANTSATNTLIGFRVGGASVNQVATITALTTGAFQDTTHSDAFLATDLIDYQISGATVGTTTITAVSVLFTTATAVSVALTGVSGTGSVGTLGKSVVHALTGVNGTGSVGTLGTNINKRVALTGISGTGSVGSVTAKTNHALTGVQGTGSVGTLTPSVGIRVPITGVSGTSALGTLGKSVVHALTGVVGTGALGTITPSSAGPVTLALTGIQGIGRLGTLTVFTPANTQGGHFLPLTEKQIRELKKRARRDRQIQDDLDHSRKLDADAIEADIRATLAPRPNATIIAQETIVETEDDDENDLIVILMNA